MLWQDINKMYFSKVHQIGSPGTKRNRDSISNIGLCVVCDEI